MAQNLVIVESPTKARTMERLLGSRYTVKPSMGHVRDLPPKVLGVAIDDEFSPIYQILPGKRKVIQDVKKASREANTIFLATDPDREGEAIAWHLVQAAELDPVRTVRVVFHELTKEAIDDAFRHPRSIDIDLVNAQQARRILDRLVGYQLSPLLWKKVGWRTLSAGRVQSVALRLVVERERQIEAFIPKEYWTLRATLQKDAIDSPTFRAELHSLKDRKGRLEIHTQAEGLAIQESLNHARYQVADIQYRTTRFRPAPPFTTSTLQQEAGRQIHFTVKKTMAIAQQLYEGIDLEKEGSMGLITYMRTDSTQLALSAVREAREVIQTIYGPEYLPANHRIYARKSKGAQEAHEAIRPTTLHRQPHEVQKYLTSDQFKLYDLIWRRMIACQMGDSVSDATTLIIEANPETSATIYVFRATGTVLRFPGFRAVYRESSEDDPNLEGTALPTVEQDDSLTCNNLEALQHFTQPPPPYTEARLVKALEDNGIGRPSTYAPTIATLQEREYVTRQRGRLQPTPLGLVVNDLLVQNFSTIFDVAFTARLEEQLDHIAKGTQAWPPVVASFYAPLEKALKEAQSIPKISIPSGEFCDLCERPLVIKVGRYGKFLSCSGFPECRRSKPFLVRAGVNCPCCPGELVERQSRKKASTSWRSKRPFYGCSNYPTCAFTVNQRPIPTPCSECGSLLVSAGRDSSLCTSCGLRGPIPEIEIDAALVQ